MNSITVSAGENLEKLVGNGRQGDFVHATQQMASPDGFRNVSKLWIDKTITFALGLEQLEENKGHTEDILASPGDMVATDENGKFGFAYKDGRVFGPTPHAFAQLGTKLGYGKYVVEGLAGLRNDYSADRGDAKALADLINNGMRKLKQDKELLWRTRDDGTLRAVLSNRYSAVDNEWFLNALEKLIPGGRLSHWKGDADTIYGNILIPDSIRGESDSDYGGMISIGNSEIGERKVNSVPSVFRAICMNGCIWDQTFGQGITKVHRDKICLDELYLALQENIQKQIPLIPQGIELLLGTRRLAWDGASMKPLFAQISLDNKITKRHASYLLEAYQEEQAVSTDSEKTLFGLVNSVTRAGQRLSNQEWVQFDSLGGRLASMGEDGWQALTGRAKLLKSKQVDGAFATN